MARTQRSEAPSGVASRRRRPDLPPRLRDGEACIAERATAIDKVDARFNEALAGVDVTKMMRRAGHDHVQTTMGYVKLAEDLTGDLGAPFGPLPPQLGEPDVGTGPTVGPSAQNPSQALDIIVPEEGVEPPT